jgi:hypothetical protein
VTLPGDIKAIVGRGLKDNGSTINWAVLETSTGLAIGTGKTAEAALEVTKGMMAREGALDELQRRIDAAPKVSQEQLEADWLKWAELQSEAQAAAHESREEGRRRREAQEQAERDLFAEVTGKKLLEQDTPFPPEPFQHGAGAVVRETTERWLRGAGGSSSIAPRWWTSSGRPSRRGWARRWPRRSSATWTRIEATRATRRKFVT